MCPGWVLSGFWLAVVGRSSRARCTEAGSETNLRERNAFGGTRSGWVVVGSWWSSGWTLVGLWVGCGWVVAGGLIGAKATVRLRA